MEDIEINKISLDHVHQLLIIGRQTFFETFYEGNTEENMTKYLDECFSLEKLTEELNDKNSETYFATLNNNIIGYLKLNFGNSTTMSQKSSFNC